MLKCISGPLLTKIREVKQEDEEKRRRTDWSSGEGKGVACQGRGGGGGGAKRQNKQSRYAQKKVVDHLQEVHLRHVSG